MATQQKKGGKKGRKIGRWGRKPKNLRYKNGQRRFQNKLKRIRKSNGEKAANDYMRCRPCHTKRYRV